MKKKGDLVLRRGTENSWISDYPLIFVSLITLIVFHLWVSRCVQPSTSGSLSLGTQSLHNTTRRGVYQGPLGVEDSECRDTIRDREYTPDVSAECDLSYLVLSPLPYSEGFIPMFLFLRDRAYGKDRVRFPSVDGTLNRYFFG